MKIKLHPEKLKLNLDTIGFVIDLLMIALVILNLGLILFDWLFQVPPVQGFLAEMTPAFHAFYRDTIHSNFLFYDLCFVAVYLTEFVIRWIVAIARSTYHRWFFYPFAHWYDLLGCIPVGSFRWLRILRVVGLVMRLQRMGIIDLSQTWLGQTILKYYGIVVEEVSDRVVINVLSGAQREIGGGSPLLHRIETQVLAPRQDKLVSFIATRIAVLLFQLPLLHGHLGFYLFQHIQQGIADQLVELLAFSLGGTDQIVEKLLKLRPVGR